MTQFVESALSDPLSHLIKKLKSLENVIAHKDGGLYERQELVAAAWGTECDVAFLSQLYDAGMAACESLKVMTFWEELYICAGPSPSTRFNGLAKMTSHGSSIMVLQCFCIEHCQEMTDMLVWV